ncbi:MAG: hypothetical protein M3T56_04150 [Chloroflexota bacterium]|nr:hypothetical protein [Chloroflexota bacterium]
MASLCCTNETDSVGELASRKKGEDAVAGDTSEYRGRDPDLEKDKLGWGVSVRADRDPRTFGGDDAQPFHIEVLSVRIRVDLERGPGLDRATSDPLPIACEPSAKVVNAAARMGEDLDVPILEAAKVSVGLVVA